MKSFEFRSGFNRSRPMLTNRGFKQTATVNNSLATVVRFLGILPSLKKTRVVLCTAYPASGLRWYGPDSSRNKYNIDYILV